MIVEDKVIVSSFLHPLNVAPEIDVILANKFTSFNSKQFWKQPYPNWIIEFGMVKVVNPQSWNTCEFRYWFWLPNTTEDNFLHPLQAS